MTIDITLRGKRCTVEGSYEDLDGVYVKSTDENLTGSLTSEELGIICLALNEQYYVQAEARADCLMDR